MITRDTSTGEERGIGRISFRWGMARMREFNVGVLDGVHWQTHVPFSSC